MIMPNVFKERFENMQRWFAHLRRHNANIFDVFFKDLEVVAD